MAADPSWKTIALDLIEALGTLGLVAAVITLLFITKDLKRQIQDLRQEIEEVRQIEVVITLDGSGCVIDGGKGLTKAAIQTYDSGKRQKSVLLHDVNAWNWPQGPGSPESPPETPVSIKGPQGQI